MSSPTRLDPTNGGLTRLDPAGEPTRRDAQTAVTRLDAPARSPRSVFNLPSALATRWRIVAPIPAAGAEAELFVVADVVEGSEAVAKIYRPGLKPRSGALDRIAGAARDHVVAVVERGESDGLAYEVMEYCRHGSLRALLVSCTGDPERIEAILAELAPALAALHAAGLIHRDLKPENVLVRSLEPLDLVLADFGIASVAEGTHHFTSTSRTVRYAAPEAMTGVISAKADCWSLGMILLEALTGRHPFEGLSEAVVNHQLVTRSVEVTGVADPAWRALLRGLLLRDPERRWGIDEVVRWLAHEPTFDRTRAPEDGAAAVPLARPYEIGTTRCFTAEELGVALVRNWAEGARDLARGLVTSWLRDELRDRTLTRFVLDLADDTGLSPDLRLLVFAWRVAPTLPAVWKGMALADDSLAQACQRAIGGSAADAQYLAEVYRLDLAVRLPEGHPEAAGLARRLASWRARVDAFQALQDSLLEAERAEQLVAAREPGAVDVDELMFGRDGNRLARIAPPLAALLAIDIAPHTIGPMRDRVSALAFELAPDCGWLLCLGAPSDLTAEGVVLLDAVSARARTFAHKRKAGRARAAEAMRMDAERFQRELDALVRACRVQVAEGVGDFDLRARMRGALRQFATLHATMHDETHALAAFEAVRTGVRKAAPPMHAIALALDRLDYLDRVRTAVVSRVGQVAIAVIVLLIIFRTALLLYAALGAVFAGIAWYVLERIAVTDRLGRAVARLPAPAGPRPSQEA